MKNKQLMLNISKIKQTFIHLLVGVFILSLTPIVAAKQVHMSKTAVEAISPESIDLTQPTLFVVTYTNLDDMWRWSYPQTIRDFLRRTMEENFAAFEEYPIITSI